MAPMRILVAAVALASSSACLVDLRDAAMGDALRDAPTDVEQAATVCADGPRTFGIDVSKWQGTIDWGDVRADGARYAFIRVSDGVDYPDARFQGNWDGAKQAGVLRGAYQFFRPDESAIAQADLLIDAVLEGGPADLPPVIDVEVTGGRSASTIVAQIATWIDRVEDRLGVQPIIYSGKYFWQDHVGNSRAFRDHPLWHPQYTSASCPNIADAWDDWAFWQYSAEGRVAGISGDVDMNRFNGGFEDLLPARPPRGRIGLADCTRIRGRAVDDDAPEAPVAVKVFFDGERAPGVPRVVAETGAERIWRVATPNRFKDGRTHEVRAYAYDTDTGEPTLLSNGPLSFTCPRPVLPLSEAEGVLRRVPGTDAMASWGFGRNDVAPYPGDELQAYARDAAWPESPRLVKAIGGTTIWLVDGDRRRRVPGADALAAWGFESGDVEALDEQALAAWPVAHPLPDRPFLLRVEGEARVRLLDVAPPGGPEAATADDGEGDPLDDVPLPEEEEAILPPFDPLEPADAPLDDALEAPVDGSSTRDVDGTDAADEPLPPSVEEGGCAQTSSSSHATLAAALLLCAAARSTRRDVTAAAARRARARSTAPARR